MLSKHIAGFLQATMLAACLAFLASRPTCGASAENGSPWTREAIVVWLSRQESLVRSMECTFETNRSPTRPENIPLIDEVCRRLGKKNRYIFTEEGTKTHDAVTRWRRKGVKERWDRFRLAAPGSDVSSEIPFNTLAFDGQIIRSMSFRDEGTAGSIDTIEGAHWHSFTRTDPYSFIYEYGGVPYSTIISRGRDFDISTVVDDGRTLTRVSVGHPDFDWRSFVLLFDQEHRLVERQNIVKLGSDPAPRLYARHVFSDYRKHEDASGETIWFPHRAVYHHYMGNLPDGTPVEYFSEATTIKNTKFNVDLSDDIFVIQFPRGAKIWDGITGFGWIYNLAERAQGEAPGSKPYYGRVLFEDGDPVFVKSEPKAFENHIFLVEEGRIRGRNYALVDDEGYFKVYLSQEQLQRLKSGRDWFRVSIPLDEKRTFRRENVFAYNLLSPDKAKAGIARIPKPLRKPISLVGKPLPELKGPAIGPLSDDADKKMILVCFWDMNQRPSRNCIVQLAGRAGKFEQEGVTVVAVQSSGVDESVLDAWMKKNRIPFPIGLVQSDAEKIRSTWGARSLPWLILTDRRHKVRAEGFGLEELDDKVREVNNVAR
ncbi:MAG: peroxiredoxin family protein [Planctomycetota bacterium]|jgi:hypothetical protein